MYPIVKMILPPSTIESQLNRVEGCPANVMEFLRPYVEKGIVSQERYDGLAAACDYLGTERIWIYTLPTDYLGEFPLLLVLSTTREEGGTVIGTPIDDFPFTEYFLNKIFANVIYDGGDIRYSYSEQRLNPLTFNSNGELVYEWPEGTGLNVVDYDLGSMDTVYQLLLDEALEYPCDVQMDDSRPIIPWEIGMLEDGSTVVFCDTTTRAGGILVFDTAVRLPDPIIKKPGSWWPLELWPHEAPGFKWDPGYATQYTSGNIPNYLTDSIGKVKNGYIFVIRKDDAFVEDHVFARDSGNITSSERATYEEVMPKTSPSIAEAVTSHKGWLPLEAFVVLLAILARRAIIKRRRSAIKEL